MDGAVWIIGTDTITGLGIVNRANAYARLGEDEKCYVRRADLGLPPGKPMIAVSESGFYKLVLRSDKPEAAAFREWVTREVLPAIRRTGGYRLQGVAPEAVEEGGAQDSVSRWSAERKPLVGRIRSDTRNICTHA